MKKRFYNLETRIEPWLNQQRIFLTNPQPRKMPRLTNNSSSLKYSSSASRSASNPTPSRQDHKQGHRLIRPPSACAITLVKRCKTKFNTLTEDNQILKHSQWLKDSPQTTSIDNKPHQQRSQSSKVTPTHNSTPQHPPVHLNINQIRLVNKHMTRSAIIWPATQTFYSKNVRKMQQIKEKLMRCSATHVGYFGVKDSTSKPATKHMYELKEGEVNPEKKERRRNTQVFSVKKWKQRLNLKKKNDYNLRKGVTATISLQGKSLAFAALLQGSVC